ncbi:MAG: FmdB family zinc ribbon protein [Actinomycetota bacterium]
MPTYEYVCTNCGNRIEVFRRIDEEAVTICDQCGGELRKVFHPAGIVFKGSGFYATDSRKSSQRAGDKGDKKEDAGSGTAKKDAKGDTKGEAKKKGDASTSSEKAG